MIGVDNGSDFKSATFRRACENEGIRVEFRPPGRPHYGGHIERLMGTMMKDVRALPGTTFSSVAERGRQDPAESAGLTLHELETHFAIEIAEGYHQRIHRGLQRAPIAVWREFIGEAPLRMPRDRMAFWVSFLPEARRKLRPDGVHMFGSLKYWHGALATDLARSGREVVVKYDPRDISKVFVGRPSGHFVEAHWSDLTWPAVSLHEWNNQQRERGRSARFERDTGAALRATARKRSLIERAKRLTYEANEKHLPQSRKPVDTAGLRSLKGVDSSKPVPGEGWDGDERERITRERCDNGASWSLRPAANPRDTLGALGQLSQGAENAPNPRADSRPSPHDANALDRDLRRLWHGQDHADAEVLHGPSPRPRRRNRATSNTRPGASDDEQARRASLLCSNP